jgi:hypothetical protein
MTKPLEMTEKTLLKLSKLPRKKMVSIINGAKLDDNTYQFTQEQASAYIARIDAWAEERRQEAARIRKNEAAWEAVIAPLNKEINSVGARLSKYRKETQLQGVTESDPRLNVYTSYLKILQTTMRKLRALQSRDMNTPIEEYRQLHDVPDTQPAIAWGNAWADWVPQNIKLALQEEHSRLQQPNTRTLVPLFSRSASIEQTNRKLRAKIFQAWDDEKNQLLTLLDSGSDPNPDHTSATIEMIEEAVRRVEAQPLSQKPLAAWQRYIGTETRARITRENLSSWRNRPSNQSVEQPTLDQFDAYWHED